MKCPETSYRFQAPGEWRDWLQEHHASEKEAWLVIRRAGSTNPGIYYEEAIEEALCFGWIDGVMNSMDEVTYALRFSPRRRGSIWSVSNQRRVEKLISQERMTGAGMARIREAKENGEWEAAQRREDTSIIPADLADILRLDPETLSGFENLPPSQKRQAIHWILSARTQSTRQKRIDSTLEMVKKSVRLGSE